MRRTSRLFELIQLLRSASQPLTADVLAARLEVCKRTIYRDVASLQSMAIPIYGEAGIGYVMRPGYDLPPLMLSVEEVEAVVIGLCLLQRTGDRGLKAAAEVIQGKIVSVLPEAVRQPLVQDSLYASPSGIAEPESVDLSIVRRAIREEQRLLLEYGDEEGRVTVRIVRPIVVIYYIDVLHIIAWCELRQAFRRFRADRIRSCSLHGTRFPGEGESLRMLWLAEADKHSADWSRRAQ